MQDWYNDPPEKSEEPECPKCGEPADFVSNEGHDTKWSCTACGHEFVVKTEEPEEPEDADPPGWLVWYLDSDEHEQCPHGREWVECDECMLDLDSAFDEARERSF